MTSDAGQTSTSLRKLMHAIIDDLSTIISIAQFYGLNEDLPSETQADMKRMVQIAREVSSNVKRMAEILLEDG